MHVILLCYFAEKKRPSLQGFDLFIACFYTGEFSILHQCFKIDVQKCNHFLFFFPPIFGPFRENKNKRKAHALLSERVQ
jgi:hypothetical protein